MKRLLFIAIFLPVSSYSATGPDLAGRWVHLRYQSMRVEISDNGSSFIVTEYQGKTVKKHASKLVDGMLTINVGPFSANADIDKKSGNLIYGGTEYRRLKPGESFEYVEKKVPGW